MNNYSFFLFTKMLQVHNFVTKKCCILFTLLLQIVHRNVTNYLQKCYNLFKENLQFCYKFTISLQIFYKIVTISNTSRWQLSPARGSQKAQKREKNKFYARNFFLLQIFQGLILYLNTSRGRQGPADNERAIVNKL